MDQSSNKGIYKDIQCSFKTMNIEVLWIFEWEYLRRCCNYCTSVLL